jgi:hypothetical protein
MATTFAGVCVSILGHCTSALGFNLQRYAHIMDSTKPLVRRWPWILGFLCLSVYKVINFVAVSVITPLGSFSIITNAIFDEPVTVADVSGISYATFGAILIVVNGPSKDFTVDKFKTSVACPMGDACFALGWFYLVSSPAAASTGPSHSRPSAQETQSL